MPQISRFRVFALLILLGGLTTPASRAQTAVDGAVGGTVVDASGAMLDHQSFRHAGSRHRAKRNPGTSLPTDPAHTKNSLVRGKLEGHCAGGAQAGQECSTIKPTVVQQVRRHVFTITPAHAC